MTRLDNISVADAVQWTVQSLWKEGPDMHFMGGADDPWKRFAETGNIYYYLDYKTHQQVGDALSGKDSYAADGDDGACATASQGGGGRSDSDDPDP